MINLPRLMYALRTLCVLSLLFSFLPMVYSGTLAENSIMSFYFDGNINEATGNVSSPTNNGSQDYSPGVVNNGRYFNASLSQYIHTNYIGNSLSSFTFNVWVKPDDLVGSKYLFGKRPTATDRLAIRQTADTLGVQLRNNVGGITSLDSTQTISTGSYQMFTVVYDGTDVSLYINGTFDSSSSFTGTIDPSLSYLIGAFNNSGNPTNFYNGALDEINFFSRNISQAEIDFLYNGGAPTTDQQFPFGGVMLPNVMVNVPADETNYTFDIENVLFDISSNVNTSCSYTYNSSIVNMDTSDNLNHTKLFNMGVATTSQKTFEVQFNCADLTNTSLIGSSNVTFYQQQIPLNLSIFVPIDEQTFLRPINAIEFHIQTNYQADCSYLVTGITNQTNFTSTSSSVHKTNYTTLFPSIDTYPLTFFCMGTILNESVNSSITFFLQDEQVIVSTSLTSLTGQLPQVGFDIGGFLRGLLPLGTVILIFAIMGGVMSILFIVINHIEKFINVKGKK